jgi:hypothetical protein
MKIYLDFDGTVVEHQYPKMGRCNFGCMEIIKKLQDAGHEIILNTYRADCNDGSLQKALDMFDNAWMLTISHDPEFNLSPIGHLKEKRHPMSFDVPYFKEKGIFFIDDQCNGTPLKKAAMSDGWMVDWDALDVILDENGIYNPIN